MMMSPFYYQNSIGELRGKGAYDWFPNALWYFFKGYLQAASIFFFFFFIHYTLEVIYLCSLTFSLIWSVGKNTLKCIYLDISPFSSLKLNYVIFIFDDEIVSITFLPHTQYSRFTYSYPIYLSFTLSPPCPVTCSSTTWVGFTVRKTFLLCCVALHGSSTTLCSRHTSLTPPRKSTFTRSFLCSSGSFVTTIRHV